MIKIAVVEDEREEAEHLERLLVEYAEGRERKFLITKFDDPKQFLEKFQSEYDILFFDICMPGLSGMELAHKIRESNSKVTIIFVTNMLQYAVEGYSVQAADFIVKPVNATSVARIMNRVVEQADRNGDKVITIRNAANGSTHAVKVNDVYYVEVSRHRLTYHTKLGNFVDWGSMDAVQSKLPAKAFARCHVSYLVNLNYVRETKKDTVLVGKEVLPVSRSHKSEFYAALAAYLGEV